MSEKSSNYLSCSRATEWLHLLLDTELSSVDHEKLLAHLQTCERCSAAQRELSMIEAAHPELDARLTAVPKDYFTALPQQVMARIEGAGAAHAKPRAVKLQPRVFDLRAFIFGRGKYALAFAAVLALAFIVTRQLREQERPSAVLSDTARTRVPTLSRAESPASETPTQNEALSTTDTAASLVDVNQATPVNVATESITKENIVTDVDTNLADDISEFAVAPPSEAEQVAQTADSAQMLLQATTALAEVSSDTVVTQPNLPRNALQLVNNPQAGRAEVVVESRGATQFDTAREPATLAKARQSAAPTALHTAALETEQISKTALLDVTEARLAQALTASARAATQSERLKIWQEYFSYTPSDSSSYAAAVESLARRLLAQSDSSSAITQMQQTLSFYQTMETILASRWGRTEYDLEKARLEGLLNWKKSSQP